MKVGYLMTVFPHQGHLWFWREVSWMREWKVPLQIFATRHAEAGDRAKHGWADAAEKETEYLWPIGAMKVLWLVLTGFFRSPIGFIRCIYLGLTIDVDQSQRPRFKHTLPLIIAACHLASMMRKHGITHLHTHTAAKGAIICMMIERLTGVPWSMIVNAHIEWWGGAMEHKFKEAQHTFFVTQWMIEQMERDYTSIPRDKYSLGRVGVDSRKWKPDPSGKPENEVPVVLAVGRLVSSKNHNHAIEAIKLLKDQGIAAKLKVGGDGPERDNLRALIEKLDVGDRVEMLGNLSEERYLDEMKKADIFVLASHGEPMGVVYMEAQAMEVPAIGCNALGAKELIVDGQTGILVPPNSPPDIAAALVKLIADPELRRQMGKAGRRHVLANFDSKIWACHLYKYLFKALPPGYQAPADVEKAANAGETPAPQIARAGGSPAPQVAAH
jgi:colanic acid/amylovoran biosynthesis glycosyltransferase